MLGTVGLLGCQSTVTIPIQLAAYQDSKDISGDITPLPVRIAASGSFFPSAELVELNKVPASHSLLPVKVLNGSPSLNHIKDAGCCYLLKYRSQDIQDNDFISCLCYLWWKGIKIENKQHHNDRKRKVHI